MILYAAMGQILIKLRLLGHRWEHETALAVGFAGTTCCKRAYSCAHVLYSSCCTRTEVVSQLWCVCEERALFTQVVLKKRLGMSYVEVAGQSRTFLTGGSHR